ncbi:uncharacterized protein PpBr36_09695 [Pyricularia pennisetigena]|uniref:uncharacterized protein n=1 Tax=Pyricularia pennisetigena TaxID=1578925 RepID=UPI0011548FA3|nr:uncharacterized protein PpBr36_09695 [Pyricularia pennisetigena]TLS22419.1 hypothetical protein PpBr36_09695 [Pyricularia pennisetigena]
MLPERSDISDPEKKLAMVNSIPWRAWSLRGGYFSHRKHGVEIKVPAVCLSGAPGVLRGKAPASNW